MELVSNASARLFPENTLSSFPNFSPEQLNLKGPWEVAISEIPSHGTHQGTKMSRRENLYFLTRNFQSRQNSTTWNLVFTLPLRILLKWWALLFKKDTITAKTGSQLKCLEDCKKLRFNLRMKDLVLYSSARIWDTFSEVMSVLNLEWSQEEKDLSNQNLHTTLYAYIVSRHCLMVNTDLIEYNIVGDTKAPMLRCFLFISKLNSGDNITTGQFMNYQTFGNLQFGPLLKKSFHSIHFD